MVKVKEWKPSLFILEIIFSHEKEKSRKPEFVEYITGTSDLQIMKKSAKDIMNTIISKENPQKKCHEGDHFD